MLLSVRSVSGNAQMNSINFIARVAQGFLAIAATSATVVALQIAMLA
jgi:hypothetical protein